MAEDFVEGVVAADVFAENEAFAGLGEEGGGVEAAGVVEGDLGGAKGVGGGEDVGWVEGGAVGDGWVGGGDGVDGGFSAESAGGGAEEVAGETLEIEGDVVGEENEGVVFAGVGVDVGDLVGVADDGFGEEKPGGEFAVVAGGAHEDGEGVAVDDELEGFLDGSVVAERGAVLAGEREFFGGAHGVKCRWGGGGRQWGKGGAGRGEGRMPNAECRIVNRERMDFGAGLRSPPDFRWLEAYATLGFGAD